MRIVNLTSWEFYANHIFLRINFYRDPSKLDLNKPAVYLINYEIKSDLEYFMTFVDPDHRDKWRELLPAEIKDVAVRREKLEADLIKQGVRVDTNYIDPPIPK